MSIGLCCQYILPVQKRTGKIVFENQTQEQTLQYNQYLNNKYSKDKIEQIWIDNISNLFKVIKIIKDYGYRCFRISSGLFPLFDQEPELLKNSIQIINILKNIGSYVKENNIRLTSHPDQFVVLSSNKQSVINNSINILNHHAWIFDMMGLAESSFYAINIHGGVRRNSEILINSINKLNSNVKNRLTLENDEKCYNINDLLNINSKTKIPIVLDSHHYSFNPSSLTLEEAVKLTIPTWEKIKPLQHLSNTEPDLINGNFQEKRKHSKYVHYIPDIQKELLNNNEIDIEFEFKMKNIAIEQSIKDLELKL